jgi:predicted AAA+ superfamily ATPase
MKYINRLLDLKKDSKKKVFFLFGPRQTGKTSLLKHIFPKAPFYNLLLSDLFIRLSQKPSILREEILAIKNLSEELKLKNKIVVSMDMKKRKIGDILIYPVKDFLEALWSNSF